jgi:endonuclease III
VKNETTYVRKFAALFKKIKASSSAEAPPQRDPVTQMVVSFLEWNATRKQARDAHSRVMAVMVDNNDLRVSHPHEIVALIGERYPQAEERAARLHEALHEVFVREHAVALDSLTAKPKKQIRTYLETVPGIVPYVAAQVLLLSFEGHAVPVDENLVELLKQEEAIDPEATLEEVASFLERHIKAEDTAEAHHLLRDWADSHGGRSARKAPAKKPARKSAKG